LGGIIVFTASTAEPGATAAAQSDLLPSGAVTSTIGIPTWTFRIPTNMRCELPIFQPGDGRLPGLSESLVSPGFAGWHGRSRPTHRAPPLQLSGHISAYCHIGSGRTITGSDDCISGRPSEPMFRTFAMRLLGPPSRFMASNQASSRGWRRRSACKLVSKASGRVPIHNIMAADS
jgi:hypothetical protein